MSTCGGIKRSEGKRLKVIITEDTLDNGTLMLPCSLKKEMCLGHLVFFNYQNSWKIKHVENKTSYWWSLFLDDERKWQWYRGWCFCRRPTSRVFPDGPAVQNVSGLNSLTMSGQKLRKAQREHKIKGLSTLEGSTDLRRLNFEPCTPLDKGLRHFFFLKPELALIRRCL